MSIRSPGDDNAKILAALKGAIKDHKLQIRGKPDHLTNGAEHTLVVRFGGDHDLKLTKAFEGLGDPKSIYHAFYPTGPYTTVRISHPDSGFIGGAHSEMMRIFERQTTQAPKKATPADRKSRKFRRR